MIPLVNKMKKSNQIDSVIRKNLETLGYGV
jgi:hypothetical protein